MIKKVESLERTIDLNGKPPVTTRQELIDFVDSHAAYASQVTLYNYVKARRHIDGAAVCVLVLFAAM